MKSSVNHRMIIETKGDEIEFARKFWAEIKRLARSESAPEQKPEITTLDIPCPLCTQKTLQERHDVGKTSGKPYVKVECTECSFSEFADRFWKGAKKK